MSAERYGQNKEEEPIAAEVGLEMTLLFDEVQVALASASKANTANDTVNEAHGIIASEEYTPLSCATAASYSIEKDKTVVMHSTTVDINGKRQICLKIQAYQGAPVGYVYGLNNPTQFELPANQAPKKPDQEQVNKLKKEMKALEEEYVFSENLDGAIRSLIHEKKNSHLIAEPLQEVSALWDEESRSYEELTYGEEIPGEDRDDYSDLANIRSLRIWLQTADQPLDIF